MRYLCLFMKMTLTLGCNILSFSGGGSHGAVEAGIFSKIYQGETYSAILGVSAGSLNSAFLGKQSNMSDGIENLLKLYQTVKTRDIYHPILNPTISLLNTSSLNQTLQKYLPENGYHVPTFIGTVNITSGNFEVFDLSIYNRAQQIDLLMASSAIPVMFPPVKLNNSYYVDGGLINNQIVSNVFCNDYVNLTYITPSFNSEDWTDEINLNNLIRRNIEIHRYSQNNMIPHLFKNCDKPVGEINILTTKGKIPCGTLDFDCGATLIEFGRKYITYLKYPYCII